MAESIKQLKLEINHVTLTLSDPYCDGDIPTMDVDVDLGLTAFSNGRRFSLSLSICVFFYLFLASLCPSRALTISKRDSRLF